jgi:transposase-like protein
MTTISFARHQFPHDIIRHAVWLYLRFTLSFREVEELLAERGLDVSYETVRRWVLKFGRRSPKNFTADVRGQPRSRAVPAVLAWTHEQPVPIFQQLTRGSSG